MKYSDGSAVADFTGDDDGTPPGYDLTADFTAPSLGVVGLPAEAFEAVVYAASSDGTCDYETVLGATSGADLTSPDTYPGQATNLDILDVSIDGPNPIDLYTVQVLGIDENLATLASLPAPLTSPYIVNGDDANLYVCLELQQFGCGRKQEFADVWIDIEIDLVSKCETCPIAYIKREGPAKDGDKVEAPDLVCYLGDETPGPKFYQGDEIQACIKYDEDSLGDSSICFGTIKKFDVTIYEYYDNCDDECYGELESDSLLALTGNPFTQVGLSTCNPLGAGVTECCVTFMPPQTLIQQLEPGEKLKVGIEAKVWGTYDCGARYLIGSEVDGRNLQDSAVPISTIMTEFNLEYVGENNAPGPFNLFTFISNLISALLKAIFG